MIFPPACRRDHGVDHDRSGVARAAWFRRWQSGESGGRGCAERQDGAGQRSQDGGETGDEAGVMDTVPRDSRCSSGPIMQSYSPAASGVSDTPIGSRFHERMMRLAFDTPASALGSGGLPGSHASGSLMRCPSLGALFPAARTPAST